MKKILIAALMAGVSTTAFASDLPTSKPGPEPVYVAPPPVFNWSGFYIGANAAYAFGDFRHDSGFFGDPKGGLFGGTVGYNYQIGQFVTGLEGDFAGGDVSRSRGFADGSSTSARLDSFVTIRARAGFAMDRALLYVTGGYAGGEVKASYFDAIDPALSGSASSWESGYALGAGIEYAFTNNISAKAEYIFSQLGDKSYFGGGKAGLDVSLVRVGLNYHF